MITGCLIVLRKRLKLEGRTLQKRFSSARPLESNSERTSRY